MNQDKPECVFESQNFHEAAMVREFLEASGIQAYIFDSNAAGSVAMFGPVIMVRVMVQSSDRQAALKVISEKEGK